MTRPHASRLVALAVALALAAASAGLAAGKLTHGPFSGRLLAWDWAAERWINSHHHFLLDWLLLPISTAGDVGAIWLLTGLGLIVFGRGRARRTGLVLLVAMVVADRVGVASLQHLFPRTRPYLADPNIRQLGVAWAGGSFPSGHAPSVVIAVLVLSTLWPRLRGALAVFALLTLYARPYLGMHFPLDVLAGAALGAVVGLFACWAQGRWEAAAAARAGQGTGRGEVRAPPPGNGGGNRMGGAP